MFPGLRFQVRPIGLTPEQVRAHDLPSTPLKKTEKRARKWEEGTGVEQTEIDALATLQPDVLEAIVREAIDPFFDAELDDRVRRAREAWEEAEQPVIDAAVTDEDRQAIDADRAVAASALGRTADRVTAIRRRVVLPDRPDVPQAVVDVQAHGKPLIDSDWPFSEQTQALKARKEYRGAT